MNKKYFNVETNKGIATIIDIEQRHRRNGKAYLKVVFELNGFQSTTTVGIENDNLWKRYHELESVSIYTLLKRIEFLASENIKKYINDSDFAYK